MVFDIADGATRFPPPLPRSERGVQALRRVNIRDNVKGVTTAPRYSIVGDRAPIFWAGCAAISAGVLLHVPMLGMAHSMGNHLSGMPMDPWMYGGMALIAFGVPAACYGALPRPRTRHLDAAGTLYEAPNATPLGGGVAVQGLAFAGLVPTLGGAALGLLLPMGLSALLVGYAGRETRGRSLRELEAAA